MNHVTRTECERATRFVHTDDGWQDWLRHVDTCDECRKDLEYFHPDPL